MGVIETGLGLALGAANDWRQIRQQTDLQNLQIEGQKALTKYNREQALQMWKDTNYSAQAKEMEKAGLNVGLMYGMGGGGGTTANVPTGSVTGASAPSGGGEMGMALQLGMMDAQKKLLEAQARNLNVDSTKKEGADTELTRANIAATIQNALKTELENNYMGKGAYKDGMTGYEVRYQKEAAEMYNTVADTEIKKLKLEQMPVELQNEIKRVALEGQRVAIEAQNARTAEERNRITERIEGLRRNLMITMQGNEMRMQNQGQMDANKRHTDMMEQKDQDQLGQWFDRVFSATVPWYEPSTTTETRSWSDDGETHRSGGSTTTRRRN